MVGRSASFLFWVSGLYFQGTFVLFRGWPITRYFFNIQVAGEAIMSFHPLGMAKMNKNPGPFLNPTRSQTKMSERKGAQHTKRMKGFWPRKSWLVNLPAPPKVPQIASRNVFRPHENQLISLSFCGGAGSTTVPQYTSEKVVQSWRVNWGKFLSQALQGQVGTKRWKVETGNNNLEPQTTIYKWMFGETTIFYIEIWNHPIETAIYKWLFGVPGIYERLFKHFNCRIWYLFKPIPIHQYPKISRNLKDPCYMTITIEQFNMETGKCIFIIWNQC